MESKRSLKALEAIEIFAKSNTPNIQQFLYLQGQMQNEYYSYSSLKYSIDYRLGKTLELGRKLYKEGI